MSRPLTTVRISIGFSLAAGLLLVLAGVSYWETERLVDSDQMVAHTREVLDSLRATLAAVTSAESGARGFVVSGDDHHLQHYEEAAAEIPRRLDVVAELTSDNPRQQQKVASLRTAVNSRLGQLHEIIQLRRTQGMESASRFESRVGGDAAMDALRANIEAMRQEEKKLLAERTERAATSSRIKIATEIATAVFGFLVLGAAFVLYRGDVSARQRKADRLAWEARREAALGELRQRALMGGDLDQFLDHAVKLTASALQVPYAKVLELLPDGKSFLLKAGCGWKPGCVGRITVSAALDSQAGFTIQSSEPVVRGDLTTHKPVIVEDLAAEKRFQGPQLLREHGVVSGMSVIIYGQPDKPYGVLGVHTAHRRKFTEQEALFLQAMANVVAADVQRRAAEQALVQSEQRFHQLADTIPQMAWVARPDGSVEYFNKRWYEYTGLSPEQSFAPEGWTAALHPDDARRCGELWRKAVEGGETFDVECRYRDPTTGGFRWKLARALPVWTEAGDIRQWFGTVTDIDDQKRVQQTLLDADRRKNEFVATLAHELRNPIAPIAHAVEILQRVQSDDPAIVEAREIIAEQIQQIKRLVDDLLEIERVARGKIHLDKEKVALKALVNRAVGAARPLIEQRGQQLDIETPDEPVWLEVDAARIVQVLGNLLHNAIKFTPQGGRIRIAAEYDEQGQSASLSVRDTGAGIPPEMLSRIFDLFAQVESGSEKSGGGLGIGLKLVRELVELHGGTVEAHSEGAGRGSEFVVRLPCVSPSSRTTRIDAAEVKTEPAAQRRRVLLVDDHQNIVRSLAALVRAEGHEAQCAYDAVSALEIARSFQPHLVVTDIGLPGMDGYELALRLRGDPLTNNARLVAMTGFSHEEVLRRIKDAGFDDILVKPFAVAELNGMLGLAGQAPPDLHTSPPSAKNGRGTSSRVES